MPARPPWEWYQFTLAVRCSIRVFASHRRLLSGLNQYPLEFLLRVFQLKVLR
ncbi:hypothetical protein BH20ACI3_BH20ACI3_12510 [soil metagenome]